MGNCFLLSKREGGRGIKEVELVIRINSDERFQSKPLKPLGNIIVFMVKITMQ